MVTVAVASDDVTREELEDRGVAVSPIGMKSLCNMEHTYIHTTIGDIGDIDIIGIIDVRNSRTVGG